MLNDVKVQSIKDQINLANCMVQSTNFIEILNPI